MHSFAGLPLMIIFVIFVTASDLADFFQLAFAFELSLTINQIKIIA